MAWFDVTFESRRKNARLLGVRGGIEHRHDLADGALIALRAVDRAGDLVRSRAGDGIHAAAGEPALADVIRGDDELDLFDGVEGDRLRVGLAARRTGGGETEQIVVDRAVDLDVVVAVVAAGDLHGRLRVVARVDHEVRVRAGHVLQTAVDGRQRLDLLLGDGGRRAGAIRIDDVVR